MHCVAHLNRQGQTTANDIGVCFTVRDVQSFTQFHKCSPTVQLRHHVTAALKLCCLVLQCRLRPHVAAVAVAVQVQGEMISASEGVCSICVFHYMCGQLHSSRLMVGFSADFYIAAIYTCIVQLDMAAMPP